MACTWAGSAPPLAESPIQHYGVETGRIRYDGPGLNLYRNRNSP